MGTEGKRYKKGTVPSAAGEKDEIYCSELFNIHIKQIFMIFLKDEDKNYKEEVYNFIIVLPVWKDDTN